MPHGSVIALAVEVNPDHRVVTSAMLEVLSVEVIPTANGTAELADYR